MFRKLATRQARKPGSVSITMTKGVNTAERDLWFPQTLGQKLTQNLGITQRHDERQSPQTQGLGGRRQSEPSRGQAPTSGLQSVVAITVYKYQVAANGAYRHRGRESRARKALGEDLSSGQLWGGTARVTGRQGQPGGQRLLNPATRAGAAPRLWAFKTRGASYSPPASPSLRGLVTLRDTALGTPFEVAVCEGGWFAVKVHARREPSCCRRQSPAPGAGWDCLKEEGTVCVFKCQASHGGHWDSRRHAAWVAILSDLILRTWDARATTPPPPPLPHVPATTPKASWARGGSRALPATSTDFSTHKSQPTGLFFTNT